MSYMCFLQMYTYMVGNTLQMAAQYGVHEDEPMGISQNLSSVLSAMIDHELDTRMTLADTLQVC